MSNSYFSAGYAQALGEIVDLDSSLPSYNNFVSQFTLMHDKKRRQFISQLRQNNSYQSVLSRLFIALPSNTFSHDRILIDTFAPKLRASYHQDFIGQSIEPFLQIKLSESEDQLEQYYLQKLVKLTDSINNDIQNPTIRSVELSLDTLDLLILLEYFKSSSRPVKDYLQLLIQMHNTRFASRSQTDKPQSQSFITRDEKSLSQLKNSAVASVIIDQNDYRLEQDLFPNDIQIVTSEITETDLLQTEMNWLANANFNQDPQLQIITSFLTWKHFDQNLILADSSQSNTWMQNAINYNVWSQSNQTSHN